MSKHIILEYPGITNVRRVQKSIFTYKHFLMNLYQVLIRRFVVGKVPGESLALWYRYVGGGPPDDYPLGDEHEPLHMSVNSPLT